MQQKKAKYPIGQQDFKALRTGGYVYVDKTEFIKRLVDNGQYYFLARPRRFGKSLFLSTLRYFFEGERQLFEGLYINSTDWNWAPYPVLHLDLNRQRYDELNDLDVQLENMFAKWEATYQVDNQSSDLSVRFQNIIEAAHKLTGRRVVILVDEYDKPLVGNLNNTNNFEPYRSKLAAIYSNFKSSAEHIQMVFLTGVSRFSSLNIFSDLNNIRDISFSNDYADICGITEHELRLYFGQGIGMLADETGISPDAACRRLKENYDGYRFARKSSDIYNPWSVLNAMEESSISNYWVRTGVPTIAAEALQSVDADLQQILNTRCKFSRLAGLDLRNLDPLALLYQTGYLTIKNYDTDTDTVTLGIPNKEVSDGLFEVLLPYYVKVRQSTPMDIVSAIILSIEDGNPEALVDNLDIFLAGIPYELKMENESNFHNALYILLTLIGINTETEVRTSDGRIDLLIKTKRFIYIIELKFGKDSATAIHQIKQKDYARQFDRDPRRRFLIGLNFNPSTRRLDPPEILKHSE